MSQKDEHCWKRLESVIAWSDMTINHFARYIGLSRSEALYQIQRGNNGLSRKMAEMVVTTFPEISLTWLISGRGDMFVAPENQHAHIDLYEADAERQIGNISKLIPDMKLVLPTDIDADFAMIYRGGAMAKTTPANSVVMLKQVEPETIIPGEEYIVVSDKVAALRIVRRADDDPAMVMLRLESSQKELYDDIFMRREEIAAAYKVVAKLIINR